MNGKKGFRRPWLSPAFLLAGLAVLAVGTSKDPPPDPVVGLLGRAIDSLDPTKAGKTLALMLQLWMVLSLGLFIAYVAYTIFEHGKYKDGKPRRTFLERMRDPRFAAAATLAFLGLLAGTLYLYRSLAKEVARAEPETQAIAERVPETEPSPMAMELAKEPPPDERVQLPPPPNWVPRLLMGALGVAALAIATMIAYRRRRDRSSQGSPDQSKAAGAAELSAVVRRARGRLHLADDVRDAIVGAYADMRALFDRDGEPDALTPREFAKRLLGLGAEPGAVRGLTALFEKARYSDMPCGSEDKAAALACLDVLAGGRHGDGRGDMGDSHPKGQDDDA